MTAAGTGDSHLHVVSHPVVAEALCALRERGSSVIAFRSALRTISRALCYEATRALPSDSVAVRTPLAEASGCRIAVPVVAAPILRAGLGMLDGFLDMVPWASVGFIGLKRDERTLEPREYYRNVAAPDGAWLYLLDPMLATGGSIVAAIRAAEQLPIARCTVVSIVAAPEGIAAVRRAAGAEVDVYVAALDERLDAHGYIVPGLGDAGDRLCDTC